MLQSSTNNSISTISLETLTTTEGKQHESVQEEELEDVEDHAAERDLQRPEVRVDAEDVDQFEEAARRGECESRQREKHQGRIVT